MFVWFDDNWIYGRRRRLKEFLLNEENLGNWNECNYEEEMRMGDWEREVEKRVCYKREMIDNVKFLFLSFYIINSNLRKKEI